MYWIEGRVKESLLSNWQYNTNKIETALEEGLNEVLFLNSPEGKSKFESFKAYFY